MNSEKGFRKLLTIATFVLVCSNVHANIITDGGFEVAGIPAWTQDVSFSDQLCGNASFPANSGACGYYFADASGGTVSQTLATVAGQSYDLDFWLWNNWGPQNLFEVFWGGVSVLQLSNIAPQAYTQQHVSVMASGASTTLSFFGQHVPGTFMIDDVSVEAVSGAVPAPAALALLGLGMAGIGYRRRKQMKA